MSKNEQPEYRIWLVNKIIELLSPVKPTPTTFTNYIFSDDERKDKFIEIMKKYFQWDKNIDKPRVKRVKPQEQSQREAIIGKLKKVAKWVDTINKENKLILTAYPVHIDSMAEFFLESEDPYQLFLEETDASINLSYKKLTKNYSSKNCYDEIKSTINKAKNVLSKLSLDVYDHNSLRKSHFIYEKENVTQLIEDIIHYNIHDVPEIMMLFSQFRRRWTNMTKQEYIETRMRLMKFCRNYYEAMPTTSIESRNFKVLYEKQKLLHSIKEPSQLQGYNLSKKYNSWGDWLELCIYTKHKQYDYALESLNKRRDSIKREVENIDRVGYNFTNLVPKTKEGRNRELERNRLRDEAITYYIIGCKSKNNLILNNALDICFEVEKLKVKDNIPVGIEISLMMELFILLDKEEDATKVLHSKGKKIIDPRYLTSNLLEPHHMNKLLLNLDKLSRK